MSIEVPRATSGSNDLMAVGRIHVDGADRFLGGLLPEAGKVNTQNDKRDNQENLKVLRKKLFRPRVDQAIHALHHTSLLSGLVPSP